MLTWLSAGGKLWGDKSLEGGWTWVSESIRVFSLPPCLGQWSWKFLPPSRVVVPTPMTVSSIVLCCNWCCCWWWCWFCNRKGKMNSMYPVQLCLLQDHIKRSQASCQGLHFGISWAFYHMSIHVGDTGVVSKEDGKHILRIAGRWGDT